MLLPDGSSAHSLKGVTACEVFQRFLEVKKSLWGDARHGLGRTTQSVSEIRAWIRY